MALKAQELQVKQQEIAMKEQLGRVKAEAQIRQTMANQALRQQQDEQAMVQAQQTEMLPYEADKGQRVIDASNWRTGKGGAASN